MGCLVLKLQSSSCVSVMNVDELKSTEELCVESEEMNPALLSKVEQCLIKGCINAGPLSCLQCLGPCLKSEQPPSAHRDSLQYTNDGFQTEGDPSRGGGRRPNNAVPRRSTFPQARSRVVPLERRSRHCSSCGVYTNHVPKGSPAARPSRRGRGDGDEYSMRSILTKQRRKEGQKTVWFKESADSSDIEVEIIPDTVGRVEEETEEELEGEVEMEGVVRDPAAPLRESDGGQENQSTEPGEEQDAGNSSSDTKEGNQEQEG